MEKRDVQVGIRMPSSLRDELKQLAAKDKRSLASYIVLVLEEHVRAHRETSHPKA